MTKTAFIASIIVLLVFCALFDWQRRSIIRLEKERGELESQTKQQQRYIEQVQKTLPRQGR